MIFSYIKNSTGVPHCECGGIVKPDVVLYEEGLDQQTLTDSVRAISQAQVLIIGGIVSCRLSGCQPDRLFQGRMSDCDQ